MTAGAVCSEFKAALFADNCQPVEKPWQQGTRTLWQVHANG